MELVEHASQDENARTHDKQKPLTINVEMDSFYVEMFTVVYQKWPK